MSYWAKIREEKRAAETAWSREPPLQAQPKSTAKRPRLEPKLDATGEDEAETGGEWQWTSLEDELEYFLSVHDVEEQAADLLKRQTAEVQQAVLDQGDMTFANNQTAVLISRIKANGGKGGKSKGKGRSKPNIEVPEGVQHSELVEKVKEFQKADEDFKQLWWNWIAERGFGKRDPAMYEKELLWEFLDFAGEASGLPTLVGITVNKPLPRNALVIPQPEDTWNAKAAGKGKDAGKDPPQPAAAPPPQASGQLMYRGQLLQRGYAGWEAAPAVALQVPDPRGPAVRTNEVNKMLPVQMTKSLSKRATEMVRCPLCKRGNKDRGSTCPCFQDPLNMDLLQAKDIEDLLDRCCRLLDYSYQSINIAMALALVSRQVETGSEICQDSRVQRLILAACSWDMTQDYTRVNLVKIVSSLSKLGATGEHLMVLVGACESCVPFLKMEEVGVLARDMERLLGFFGGPVMSSIARRCAKELHAVNITTLLLVVSCLLKCSVPETDFLTLAATAMSPHIDDFDPFFLAWLVRKYEQFGIHHATLLAAAVKVRAQHPELFTPGADPGYTTFLAPPDQRRSKGSGKGKGKGNGK